MDTRTPKLWHPERKISETFLQFAAPLLRDLPSEAPETRAREALLVAYTIWNAVVFADVAEDQRHLNQIRNVNASRPELGILTEQMIARKRALFGDDERLIGLWELTTTFEGFRLRADARDPRAVPNAPE